MADSHPSSFSNPHYLDPRTKVLLAFFFILAVSLMPIGAYLGYAALLAPVLAAAIVSEIGLRYVLRRSLVAIPFALAATTLVFTIPGEALFDVPIFGGLTATVEGMLRFTSILLKSWISVQVAVLLVGVTAFPDLMWALKQLRLPAVLISIVNLMHRYLFVLTEEAQRLLRARASRSAAKDGLRSGGSLIWRGKVAGRLAGSLMLRSLERSERIYNAMLARGYQGEFPSLTRSELQRRDVGFLIVGPIFCLVVLATATYLEKGI